MIPSEYQQAKIAAFFGVSRSAISQWFTTQIPVERCPDLEWFHDGKLTVEMMRPDVRWLRFPDRRWPHPKGRPCLDVVTVA